MVEPVVQIGNPLLRERAALVEADEFGTERFLGLVDRMVEAMRATRGVGLAAPQLGVSNAVFVLEMRQEDYQAKTSPAEIARRGMCPVPLRVVANPVVRVLEGGEAEFFESCLSVCQATLCGLVRRPLRVEVEGLDPHGHPLSFVAENWEARIVLHEVDHLQGVLFLDRVEDPRLFVGVEELRQRWQGVSAEEVRAALAPAPRPLLLSPDEGSTAL